MFMFLPFAATRDLMGIRQVRLVRKGRTNTVCYHLYVESETQHKLVSDAKGKYTHKDKEQTHVISGHERAVI